MATADAKRRFDAEVRPHAATVLRVAQLLVNSRADAEDLAQETLLKAFRFLSQFQAGSDARRWLFTILRNTAADRRRAIGRQPRAVALQKVAEVAAAPEPETAFASDASPEQMMDGFSDQRLIDALRALPAEIRWTLLLVDVEGLDQAEAAAVLAIPVGTVKSRAHRGRAMLRAALLDSVQPPSAKAGTDAR